MGNIDEYDPWVPYKKDRSVIPERVKAMRDRMVGPPEPEPEIDPYEQARKEEMHKIMFEERGSAYLSDRYKEFMSPEVFQRANDRIKNKKRNKYSNYTSGGSTRETFPRSRGNNLKNLEDYSVNITYEAYERLLDPVIGRDEEINSLVKVLIGKQETGVIYM